MARRQGVMNWQNQVASIIEQGALGMHQRHRLKQTEKGKYRPSRKKQTNLV